MVHVANHNWLRVWDVRLSLIWFKNMFKGKTTTLDMDKETQICPLSFTSILIIILCSYVNENDRTRKHNHNKREDLLEENNVNFHYKLVSSNTLTIVTSFPRHLTSFMVKDGSSLFPCFCYQQYRRAFVWTLEGYYFRSCYPRLRKLQQTIATCLMFV